MLNMFKFNINLAILTSCILQIRLCTVKQKDYTNVNLLSNLPRSKFVADRMLFNYVDFSDETKVANTKFNASIDFGASDPNWLPPQHLMDAMVEVALDQKSPDSYKIHQYGDSHGHPRLLNAVSNFYSKLMNRNINANKEIVITTGAAHALDMVARVYLNPGDEVIVFEPFFYRMDSYIRMSGGVMALVPLIQRNKKYVNLISNTSYSNNLTFDRKVFRSKFNKKTKMIWLNNPNNPTGKTFTVDELIFIGNLAEKHDVLIVSDEVGEWFYFDDQHHNRIASLKNFWSRTITICSGGKMFSNTGWRIGWAIAPEELLWGLTALTKNSVLSVSNPLQIAFAIGMEKELQKWNTPESYFNKIKVMSIKARDRMVRILESIGAAVLIPNSGNFLCANITRTAHTANQTQEEEKKFGYGFNYALKHNFNMNIMPLTVFYGPKNAWTAEFSLRFAILRTPDVIDRLEVSLAKANWLKH